VVIPGSTNKVAAFLPRLLPRALMLAMTDAHQKQRR